MSDASQLQSCRAACGFKTSTSRSAGRKVRASIVATLLAIAVLAATVVASRNVEPRDNAETSSASTSPQDAVTEFINALKAGDLAAAQNFIAEDVGRTGRKESGAGSTAMFVQSLCERRAELTGHVVSDVKFFDDASVSLVLELVYRRDNVRYEVGLRRVDNRWVLRRIEPLAHFQPEIPYGTPVIPQREDRSP